MRRALIVLMAVMLLSQSGCGEKEPIRIGIVGTMSGNGSDLAVSGRRGAELAVMEINGNGGIDGRLLELVVKDDLNDPQRADAIVDEFTEEGIELVIGHFTSGMMLSVIDKVNNADILYLAPTVSADSLSQKDDNFIRFIASTKEQAVILADTADSQEHKRFIIVYDDKNLGFNKALYENFESQLKDNGGTVISTVSYSNLDKAVMDQLLAQTKREKPDAVFIIANSADLGSMAQYISTSGYQIPLYGPLWAHTNELLTYGGDALEGSYLVGAINYNKTTEAFDSVNGRYLECYGSDMTFSSMFTYETVIALSEALVASGNTDYSAIKQEIIDIGTFEGLQSPFEIDTFGDNTRAYIIEQISGGKYIEVKK